MLAAVIDIGSNSVRLVLYHYIGHHAQPIFNEKLACALGASLIHSKRLDPVAKDRVRATITRFRQIIDVHQPDVVTAIATAAMRESEDGKEFAVELSAILGHEVRVIEGLEEARYAANGVYSTTWQPHGIVADLGGGSLDIARLERDGATEGLCSIATGTLGFRDIYDDQGKKGVSHYAKAQFDDFDTPPTDTLYAVGGSFRALARHHMKLHDYPLRVIHDYELSYDEIDTLQELMKSVDFEDGKYFIGVPRKRQVYVLPAIIVLKKLMKHIGAQRVVFSSAGVREGALRVATQDQADYDVLLAMVCAMPEAAKQQDYAHALRAWLMDVLPCSDNEARLVHAFSHISELATAVHPEHRAIMAFERMLATMGYGMTHAEQVLLALALYHRYRPKYKGNDDELVLLSKRQRHLAYAIGQIADLAHNLSAGHADLLQQFQLVADGADMIVKSRGSDAAMVPPNAANWCDGLGDIVSAFESL